MEEEISLREIIELLLKWKRMIIALTVGAAAVAALVSIFILPEVYTASATIKINPPVTIRVPELDTGEIAQDDRIIVLDNSAFKDLELTRSVSPQEIKLQATNPDFLEKMSQKIGQDISAANVSVEAASEDDPDFLEIKVSTGNPQIAAAAANAIAEGLPTHLDEIMKKEREEQNEVLTTKIEKIEEQLAEAREVLNHGSPDETQEAEARITGLEKIYTGLLMKYEEEQVIGSVETSGKNPSLVSPAAVPPSPVKPRTAQNVAIALVLGLMAGVFLAFFIEYWRSSAPRDPEEPLAEQGS
jgi:capsular polysaccharide biosynthesis protein